MLVTVIQIVSYTRNKNVIGSSLEIYVFIAQTEKNTLLEVHYVPCYPFHEFFTDNLDTEAFYYAYWDTNRN